MIVDDVQHKNLERWGIFSVKSFSRNFSWNWFGRRVWGFFFKKALGKLQFHDNSEPKVWIPWLIFFFANEIGISIHRENYFIFSTYSISLPICKVNIKSIFNQVFWPVIDDFKITINLFLIFTINSFYFFYCWFTFLSELVWKSAWISMLG